MANPPPHYGGPYWTFLRLTTDDGISGYGEACGVPFSPRRTCQLIEDVVARHVSATGRMQLIATIDDPAVVRRILAQLGLPGARHGPPFPSAVSAASAEQPPLPAVTL